MKERLDPEFLKVCKILDDWKASAINDMMNTHQNRLLIGDLNKIEEETIRGLDVIDQVVQDFKVLLNKRFQSS